MIARRLTSRSTRLRNGMVIAGPRVRPPRQPTRMLKRRLSDAGLPQGLRPHSFRVAAATDLLDQGVPLEDVQYLLGHSDARTTKLYDRREKKITRNIVERIRLGR